MRAQETKIYDASNAPVSFQPLRAAGVTPNDDTVLEPGTLFIGSTGNVAVRTKGGDLVTFTNVANSFILPVLVDKVLSTGTTASNIVIMR
jgi:hypothetical protein